MPKETHASYDNGPGREPKKNWPGQGKWYSWDSPIGLGIYLLSLAGAVWIFAHLRPKNKK